MLTSKVVHTAVNGNSNHSINIYALYDAIFSLTKFNTFFYFIFSLTKFVFLFYSNIVRILPIFSFSQFI